MKKTGIIKFYHQNGYGFIVDDESKRDIFYHMADLENGIPHKDDRVEFEITSNKKGIRAIKVKIL